MQVNQDLRPYVILIHTPITFLGASLCVTLVTSSRKTKRRISSAFDIPGIHLVDHTLLIRSDLDSSTTAKPGSSSQCSLTQETVERGGGARQSLWRREGGENWLDTN